MGAGFFYSYHLCWGTEDARTLMSGLEAEGLRFSHPVSGHTVLVGQNSLAQGLLPIGACSPVTREEFLSLAAVRRLGVVGVRLWLDGRRHALLCIRRAQRGVTVLEFGLEGLSPAERDDVVRAVRRTVGRASLLCIGFVVDRTGATAETTDWAGLVVDGTALLEGWPELLAVREEIAAEHPQLCSLDSVEQSPWRVFGSALPGV